MKKTVSLLLLLLISISLISCDDNRTNKTDLKINDVIDTLIIAPVVDKDFTIPRVIDNIDLSWSSNHASISISLNDDNTLFKVTRTQKDVSVIITVTATLNDEIKKRDFPTIVAAYEEIEKPEVSIPNFKFHAVIITSLNQIFSSQYVKDGELIDFSDEPQLENYAFDGYSLNEVPFDINTPITQDITLEVMWKESAPHVNVFYVSDGKELQKTRILYDSIIKEPVLPVIPGKKIVGYYSDVSYSSEFNFDTRVIDVLTIYVKYATITDEQEKIAQSAHQIEVSILSIKNGRIELPRSGINSTSISWSSSNSKYLTNSGVIIYPKKGEGDIEVTLRATVKGPRNSNTSPETVEKLITIPEIHYPDFVTSGQSIPFKNTTSEYNVKNSFLQTYYLDFGNIPYVDINDFLDLLGRGSIPNNQLTDDIINGFIYSNELEYVLNGHILTISYDIVYTHDDNGPLETPETIDYVLTIDFDENTIEVNTLSFFDSYVKSTSTNYSLGISYLDSYTEEGTSLSFDLDDYGIDILLFQDGEHTQFLMPFHLVNQLFTGGSYYNVYYNGDSYYGIYSVPRKGDGIYETLKTNSLNNKDVPYDLAYFNYNMLAFVMDNFYGLKEDRKVTSYYDLLNEYADGFLSTDGTSSATSLFKFINKKLDELHTSPGFYSNYTDPKFNIQLTQMDLGLNTLSWYNVLWDVEAKQNSAWKLDGDKNPIIPNYRILKDGETAVINLDGFITATAEELKNDPNSFDTDIYFQETLDSIFESNPNTKNIIVDLSYNTGGNLGALLRVLGYITDKPIEMSYQDPTEKSNQTYFAVVENYRYEKDSNGNYLINDNGERIIKKDSSGNPIIVAPREDISWYFLTSKVTFSAGNLMAAIGKNQQIATIIGTLSGGGASSIIPVSLPDGSFFTMSSLNVLSIRKGNSDGSYTYESIEHGVVPDYILGVADLYNESALINVIHQAQNPN